MNDEAVIAAVRMAAANGVTALQNGRATRAQKLASRLGLRPALPKQIATQSVFTSECNSIAISATLRSTRQSLSNPSKNVCILQSTADGPTLSIDRDVLDASLKPIWETPVEQIGDILARNLRVLKHADWFHNYDYDDGHISCVVTNSRGLLVECIRIMEDILTASGCTKEGQRLAITFPTGTRPLQFTSSGINIQDIDALATRLSPIFPATLQIIDPEKRKPQISRITASATAQGLSPMDSLRSMDRLIKQFGDKTTEAILIR